VVSPGIDRLGTAYGQDEMIAAIFFPMTPNYAAVKPFCGSLGKQRGEGWSPRTRKGCRLCSHIRRRRQNRPRITVTIILVRLAFKQVIMIKNGRERRTPPEGGCGPPCPPYCSYEGALYQLASDICPDTTQPHTSRFQLFQEFRMHGVSEPLCLLSVFPRLLHVSFVVVTHRKIVVPHRESRAYFQGS
jgi:hypothetical protein